MESPYSKVTGNFYILQFCRELNHVYYVLKNSFARNFKKFLFNRNSRLTSYNLQRHSKRTSNKFFKGAFKILDYIQESLCRDVLTKNVHRVCKNIRFLYVCMLRFHVYFAFMLAHISAFIWCQTCKSSEHAKTEFQFKRSKNDIT